MRNKILIIGFASLFFISILSSQELDDLSLSKIAKLMEESIADGMGSKVKVLLKKENDVVTFYVDCSVKDYTYKASYEDYKALNAVVVGVAWVMKRVSWKSDKVWFLRDGEKVAWISVDRCKAVRVFALSGDKDVATSHLFEGIHIVEEKPARSKWLEIARSEGVAAKNTETYHTSKKEWRISWETKPGKFGPGNFQIFVYKEDGTLLNLIANIIGANTDHSIMRGVGGFYLMINTIQPYVIVVEEKI